MNAFDLLTRLSAAVAKYDEARVRELIAYTGLSEVVAEVLLELQTQAGNASSVTLEDIEFNLTARAYNCLRNMGFTTLNEVAAKFAREGDAGFIGEPNLGRVTLAEIKTLLKAHNLM